MSQLKEKSVHCCVTSPPYWGLRDYGTAKWEGGDKGCDHKQEKARIRDFSNSRGETKENGYAGSNCTSWSTRDMTVKPGNECRKCGARRIDAQIGLEETPELYVQKMVEVFRQVRRVLCDDGTLWLNLGDTYAGSGRGGYVGDSSGLDGSVSGQDQSRLARLKQSNRRDRRLEPRSDVVVAGLKAKNLIGIPWRVAFALQADGWYLRQDIIWHKPNPMPESVTDRCTKAHEYIFLMSKSARYYYNAEAILEPVSPNTHARVSQDVANQIGSFRANGGSKTNGPMKAVVRTPKQQPAGSGIKNNDSFSNAVVLPVLKRNKRSVWTVPTKSYKGAHFATFPPKLIEPCVLAGSPVGGVILDPFSGASTTALVSRKNGRKCIGIELNEDYCKITADRLAQAVLPFGD